MSTFTLDNLREQVEKKYAPVTIETGDGVFVIQNLLQLPQDAREKVAKEIDKLDSEDAGLQENLDVFTKVIEFATKDNKGKKLLELLEYNSAMIIEVAQKWMEQTQLGEAEDSSE